MKSLIIKNKEYGSDFHFHKENTENLNSFFNDEAFQFHFSGRTAIYDLLKFGIEKRGWKKVGFPSYYCHDVVEFCKDLPIKIKYYHFNPFNDSQNIDWQDEIGSVFVNVNFFGCKEVNLKKLDIKHTVIINDVTHNLLKLKSINEEDKDYYFASLRKQLPLPVGGITFSKDSEFLGFSKTKHTHKEAESIAEEKLKAMQLKKQYLEGAINDKANFRRLYQESESKLSSISTYAVLPTEIKQLVENLKIRELIQETRSNVQLAKRKIKNTAGIKVLGSTDKIDFGLILLCETEKLRDELKMFLINTKIYPAVLWPNQIDVEAAKMSKRMLFIHLDFRYNKNDVKHIVNTINLFFNATI